ncbi:MAG: hypothetical protein ACRC46_05210 [Thermoguttaceae bacterium]
MTQPFHRICGRKQSSNTFQQSAASKIGESPIPSTALRGIVPPSTAAVKSAANNHLWWGATFRLLYHNSLLHYAAVSVTIPRRMIADIPRLGRLCAATQVELVAGDVYYSVLVHGLRDLERYDYAAAAWNGPPAECVGWWRSRVPREGAKSGKLAPNDVLLAVFDELTSQPGQEELVYILTLLLLRRRLFRYEREERSPHAPPTLVAFCPKRETTYEVTVAQPSPLKNQELQEHLARLLYA